MKLDLDKKGLKKEVSRLRRETGYMGVQYVEIREVLHLIDQLDEPEKVVVPQWFDEWYLSMKSQHFNDRYIITQLSPVFFHNTYPDYRKRNDHFNKKQWAYITENFMAMIDAVKDGYEIEKEKLYYVVDEKGQTLLFKSQERGILRSNGVDLEKVLIAYEQRPSDMYQLTEKEIKDYDERYWAFAVEVAE